MNPLDQLQFTAIGYLSSHTHFLWNVTVVPLTTEKFKIEVVCSPAPPRPVETYTIQTSLGEFLINWQQDLDSIIYDWRMNQHDG